MSTGAGLLLLPSGVLGGPRSPGKKLNIAVIGVSGRGASNLESVSSESIVALCDVDEQKLAAAAKKHPGAKTYVDWRKCLEQKDVVVEGLANRWQRGTLVMQSADTSLQPKEVPLETFFHKIVMIRNNLRVLEQKVNASDKLSDADKFDLQQYITRCYGSLTTFNILFKNKDDQFRTGA